VSSLHIAGQDIPLGAKRHLSLTVAKLYDYTDMKIPVAVVRGKEEGPALFVSAAIHGDEINGVDIVRRLLKHPALKHLKGTLIAIPIVNVFGFNDKSRYLPDRRDLNRSFPGERDGSLASQIAYIFRTEIVEKCTHGIDLHTGALHRRNLPQVRVNLERPEHLMLAKAFGAPVVLNAGTRDGSLREMLANRNIPILLFEGGTALRFDHGISEIGVRGILNVMRAIGMLPEDSEAASACDPYVARGSHWVRAPQSGIFLIEKHLGAAVEAGERIGCITNPFGEHEVPIVTQHKGVIIGQSILPLANEGDALYHVALPEKGTQPEEETYPLIDPELQE
jgi:predicted deacylase